MTVGLSIPACSGAAPGTTSAKLADAKGRETADALAVSSCSLGFASASCHSPDSVSRVSFHELVASGNATATDRAFSTLKKSLFNHGSGFGSIWSNVPETRYAVPGSSGR
jgi:hypothetical protein